VKIRAVLLLGSLSLVSFAACSIYDSSLLGAGGSTGASGPGATSTGTDTSTSSGIGGDTSTGTGIPMPCVTVSECPGMDTECQTRTCNGGTCGFDFAADGKALAAQTAKDCVTAVCNGAGATRPNPDDADKPTDANDCTIDTCTAGVAANTPKPVGDPCTTGSAMKCTADSMCVECVVNTDCGSMVCDPLTNKCAPIDCGDKVKNGVETDIDCGGITCPRCPTGKACKVSTDCVGGACTGSVCVPTCVDGLENNGETDVDCGGANCTKCSIGSKCAGNADCLTGNCKGDVCYQSHLVINEIDYDQMGTDANEFVEIYNGTGGPVSLTNLALLFIDGSSSVSYLSINLGPGTLLAGNYLVVGSATVIVPAPGIKITTTMAFQNGAPDGVALVDSTASQPSLIDALSYEGSITLATIPGLGMVSLVEGTAFTGADSNTKSGSLSRLPSGADTNNAVMDWAFSNTPTPGAPNVP